MPKTGELTYHSLLGKQKLMLYTLNLYRAVCQLYPNENEEKETIPQENRSNIPGQPTHFKIFVAFWPSIQRLGHFLERDSFYIYNNIYE